MGIYELVTIFGPEMTGEKLKKEIATVEKLLENAKGKVRKNENWGKKDLAYPIRGKKQGTYHFYTVELPAESLLAVEKGLRLNENLLRYLLVKG